MTNKPSDIKKWNPIPKVNFQMVNNKLPPQVGWQSFNDSPYQLKVKIDVHPILGLVDLSPLQDNDITGITPFVARPNQWVFFNGCFSLPKVCWESTDDLIIEIRTKVTDYDDPTKPEIELVPIRWKLVRQNNSWSYYPQIPKIIGKYYNCFISYGKPDQRFADRLTKDLEEAGVVCWLYSHDATPGERVWTEIKQKMQEVDRILVICSMKSLVRDGFLKEIEEQCDLGADKIIPISIDNLWKQEGFIVKRGSSNLKQFLLEKNYVDFTCRTTSKYNDSLKKLLVALKPRAK